jgi:hypothetical protein
LIGNACNGQLNGSYLRLVWQTSSLEIWQRHQSRHL